MIYLFLLIIILALVVAWTVKNGISPMPSSTKASKVIASLLPDVEGPVYELGSGWGHLLLPLCKKYPHQPVVGIESSPIPYLFSKVLFIFLKRPNLSLIRQDFFTRPLNDASLVVCYLYPGAMKQLRDKFQRELKPGTLIISNTFAVPGWKPEKTVTLDDMYCTKIYLYKAGKSDINDCT